MKVRSVAVAVVLVFAAGASNTATPATGGTSTASAGSTFKVGQPIQLGDFKFVVNSVKDPLKSTNEFDKPAAGTRFVGADVSITNTGTTPQTVSSLMCFDVSDKTGQQYQMSIVAGAPKPPDGELAPGRTLRGTLVYEIPTAQKTGLVMDFKCDLFSSGSASVTLQ